MEYVVDGLLRDFEAGKMTRRQLIKSLTVAAMAAAAPAPSASAQPASTIPPPLGPAPWKTVWLDHVSQGSMPHDTWSMTPAARRLLRMIIPPLLPIFIEHWLRRLSPLISQPIRSR